jgi:hypothetical protein
MTSQLQGQDEIIVEAPVERLWPLIADSTLLPDWGPPVRKAEVLGPSDQPEGLGSRRRIEAELNGKKGYFVERRTEHIQGRKIAYLIEEENFGIFRVLTQVGFSIEIESAGLDKTRVIWSFFHTPKGLLGHILNRMVILRQQRQNRLAALAALKHHAERRRQSALSDGE